MPRFTNASKFILQAPWRLAAREGMDDAGGIVSAAIDGLRCAEAAADC